MITSHLVCCVLFLMLALMHLLSAEHTWISVTPGSLIPGTSFAAHKGWAWHPDPVKPRFAISGQDVFLIVSEMRKRDRERTLQERGTRSNTLVWIPSAETGHWELACIVGGRSPQDVERLCRSFSTIYSILAHSSLCALAPAGSKEERPL